MHYFMLNHEEENALRQLTADRRRSLGDATTKGFLKLRTI